MKSSIPLDSATVILIRDSSKGQYEIYLMRRREEPNFLSGAHVFPGGCMDDEDCSTELALYTNGISAAVKGLKSHEPELPEEKLRGILFAAIREIFEEAGILLAYDSSGNILNFSDNDPAIADRFNEYRFKVYEKKITLIDIAKRENIRYATDLLIPYAHWITPDVKFATLRFDARFFITKIPQGQIPVHDNIELTESFWITPGRAMEKFNTGEINLMPPTIKTIEELNEFDSSNDLFASVQEKKINTILPESFKVENGYGIKLPHDPEYSITAFKQPHRPDETSRFIQQESRWKTVRIDKLD